MSTDKVHTYIPTLNGWRAFSILYVLLYHGMWIFLNPETGLYPHEQLWQISKNGAFGVYFFFGISGFLITTRLLEELSFCGTVSLKSFYWRRFFRIIPILLAYLTVIVVLKNLELITTGLRPILSSLFFFRNYTADVSEWYTGHFWSLSMEEHYYLLWPFLFLLFMKMKRPWIPVLLFILAVTIWRMIEYRYRILAPHLSVTEYRGRTDLFMDYILWGSLAAILNKQSAFKEKFLKVFSASHIWICLLLIHILFFIRIPLADTAKAILIQLSLLITINFPASAFSRFLEKKFIATVGLYSYSLYVWQQLVLTPNNMRIPQLSFFQTPPVNILVLALLAYLSYNFLENPAIRFGKKLAQQKP